MTWKFLFFSFKGRISRKWWWLGMLFVVSLTYGLSIAMLWMIGEDPTYYWNDQLPTPRHALVDAIAFLLTVRVGLAVDIKRIHDRIRTAYFLVPLYAGELALIAMDGTGLNPLYFTVETTNPLLMPNVLYGLFLAILIYAIWMVIELGLGRGTPGPSKYGPDPLASLTAPIDETI